MTVSSARKIVISIVIVIFTALQYRLWFGETGINAVEKLEEEIQLSARKTQQLYHTNEQLQEKIIVYQTYPQSLEKIAREVFGLVNSDETFFEVRDDKKKREESNKTERINE